MQLMVTLFPTETTLQDLYWHSTNPQVAKVDRNGLVVFQDISDEEFQECKIIVSTMYFNGPKYEFVVMPDISVMKISLNKEFSELTIGQKEPLMVKVEPENATDKTVIWNSSDPEVATVDETGLVIAVKPGSALITATTSNGLTATCEVTVLPILVESIILTPSEIQGVIGESFTIEATILPENASEPRIEWKSTNPVVATVSQVGHVEILKEGTCRIIAHATDGSDVSAECIITGVSGIESIFADGSDHIYVYTPGGILIKKDCSSDDLKNLVPGIYILKSETKTITVILR